MAKRKVQHGVVAILDALGVRSDLSEAAEKFLHRRDIVLKDMAAPLRTAEVFAYLGKEGWPEVSAPGQPKIVTFGDNIVLVWEQPEVTDDVLLGFSQPILHLIVRGLEVGLLLRGAVSFGEFILEDTTIVGPALSDAFSWAERADWVGVVATPKLGMLIDAYAEKWRRETPKVTHYFNCFYTRHPVPLKGGGTQELWCYPWPMRILNMMSERKLDAEAGREHLLRWLSQCSISSQVQSKYDNTIAFYDAYHAKRKPPPAASR